MSSARGDQGSVSILVLAAAVALVLVTPFAGLASWAVATRHQLDAAADLAALAGAYDIAAPDPCASAARVADANGAQLVRCDVVDEVVTVTVEPTRPRTGMPWRVAATARATME